mgnify:CR=1 FL=1
MVVHMRTVMTIPGGWCNVWHLALQAFSISGFAGWPSKLLTAWLKQQLICWIPVRVSERFLTCSFYNRKWTKGQKMNVNPDLLRTPTHQMTTRYRNIPIGSCRLPMRTAALSYVVIAGNCILWPFIVRTGWTLGGQRASYLVFWVARLYFSKIFILISWIVHFSGWNLSKQTSLPNRIIFT